MSEFQRGQRVFLRKDGVGHVVAFAGKDPTGQPTEAGPGVDPFFYVVKTPYQQAYIPIEVAHTLLRPVSPHNVAHEMLSRLRGHFLGESLDPEALFEKGKQVGERGDALESAAFLRELYARENPASRGEAALHFLFEQMVLGEIAEVLGEDLRELRAEMELRYPAWKRSADEGRFEPPRVVAAPVVRPA